MGSSINLQVAHKCGFQEYCVVVHISLSSKGSWFTYYLAIPVSTISCSVVLVMNLKLRPCSTKTSVLQKTCLDYGQIGDILDGNFIPSVITSIHAVRSNDICKCQLMMTAQVRIWLINNWWLMTTLVHSSLGRLNGAVGRPGCHLMTILLTLLQDWGYSFAQRYLQGPSLTSTLGLSLSRHCTGPTMLLPLSH